MMKPRCQRSSILLFACIAAIAGCATNEIQRYVAHDKDNPATNEVAYLHVPEKIMIEEIDGTGRYYPLLEPFGRLYRGAVIELLPGKHSANVIYHERYGHTSRPTVVPFGVEAGGHYEIQASITQVNHSPKLSFDVVSRSKSPVEPNR